LIPEQQDRDAGVSPALIRIMQRRFLRRNDPECRDRGQGMRETDSFLVTPDEPLPLAPARPADRSCTITILPIAQCENILLDWRALAATALEDNPFLSPDFMIPARSHLIDDSGMTLALAWEEHAGMRTLTGLFPLVPRARDFGAGWLAQSRAAMWTHALQPVGVPLLSGDPVLAEHAVAAFFSWLQQCRPRLASVDIHAIPADGVVHEMVSDQALRMGLPIQRHRNAAHTYGLDFRPKALQPGSSAVTMTSDPAGLRTTLETLLCMDSAARRDKGLSILGNPRWVAFLRAATRSFALRERIMMALIDTPAVQAGAIILKGREKAFLWWMMGPSAADPMTDAAIAGAVERKLGIPLVAAARSPLSGLGTEPLMTESLQIGLSSRTYSGHIEAEPAKTQRI
jgi:hypothetical protein